jgi:hypothetical protein
MLANGKIATPSTGKKTLKTPKTITKAKSWPIELLHLEKIARREVVQERERSGGYRQEPIARPSGWTLPAQRNIALDIQPAVGTLIACRVFLTKCSNSPTGKAATKPEKPSPNSGIHLGGYVTTSAHGDHVTLGLADDTQSRPKLVVGQHLLVHRVH